MHRPHLSAFVSVFRVNLPIDNLYDRLLCTINRSHRDHMNDRMNEYMWGTHSSLSPLSLTLSLTTVSHHCLSPLSLTHVSHHRLSPLSPSTVSHPCLSPLPLTTNCLPPLSTDTLGHQRALLTGTVACNSDPLESNPKSRLESDPMSTSESPLESDPGSSPQGDYTLSLDVIGDFTLPSIKIDKNVFTAMSVTVPTDVPKEKSITLKTQALDLFTKEKGKSLHFWCILFYCRIVEIFNLIVYC